jgi:hypothetical protein
MGRKTKPPVAKSSRDSLNPCTKVALTAVLLTGANLVRWHFSRPALLPEDSAAFRISKHANISITSHAVVQTDDRCCGTKIFVATDQSDNTVLAVVADNFLCHPLESRREALEEAAWEDGTNRGYPGSQAWLNPKQSNLTRSCMLPLISAAFGDENLAQLQSLEDMRFGNMYHAAETLTDFQLLPHIDVSEARGRLAGYATVTPLTDAFGSSGVGLYRQPGTNISRVHDRTIESQRLSHLMDQLSVPESEKRRVLQWSVTHRSPKVARELPGYYAPEGNRLSEEVLIAWLHFNRCVLLGKRID